MKKLLLSLLVCLIATFSIAQSPSYQQKLYYTCKIWGFIKYYHSNVSNCHVNWDSVLITTLPLVKAAGTNAAFNDALDTMLKAAGTMAITTTPLPDTLPAALKRNRNFSWISDPVFRTDVQVALDTIKNNFRPHPICYVENNDYTTSSPFFGGWLVFPQDTVLLNTDIHASYPDEYHRLLMVFKQWNIVNYFDPYTYVFDNPIDTILNNTIPRVVNAGNNIELYEAVRKMTSQFDDPHVEGLTSSQFLTFPFNGYYFPKLVVKYLENKYVVVLSGVSGINTGDAIVSIDAITPTEWEDSLRSYMSEGNPSVFRRDLIYYMLSGGYSSATTIVVTDSTGTSRTLHSFRNDYLSDGWFPNYYYPNDSLNYIPYTTMQCNTGYVNMGNIQQTQLLSMYNALMAKPAIIIDLRNYPYDNSAWEMADLMYPKPTGFAKLSTPDVTYPGTYSWFYDSLGISPNATPYKGKIIILVNQETQSSAEYCSMIFRAMPGAVVMGSQTAGTDGNVTYFRNSLDMTTGFTTLGVYYPNGDSTERIGIRPDTFITPTIAGIRHGEDEVLDKALSLACSLAVNEVPQQRSSISIYPNPATDNLNIEIDDMQADKATISISDITGHLLMQKNIATNGNKTLVNFDVKAFPAGMYLVNVQSDGQIKTMKFTKL